MTDQTTPTTDHIIPVHVKVWGIIALVIGAFLFIATLFSTGSVSPCGDYATINGEFQTSLYKFCMEQERLK